MTRSKVQAVQRGAVAGPVMAVGALAMGLATGLRATGLLAAFDRRVREGLAAVEAGLPAREVPWGWAAAVTALWVLGMLTVMLESPGTWRRVVLWLSAGVLTVGAVPALLLAGWWLEPGLPLVAVTWAGACALVYARRHVMPCERRSLSAPAAAIDAERRI